MWNADQRRRALSERLRQLTDAVSGVESQPEVLTTGQKVLLDDLDVAIQGITTNFEETWHDFEKVRDLQERERSRAELCLNFEELVQTLIKEIVPVMTGASASLVPVELEPVVNDEVTAAAPGRNLTPILFSTPDFRYAIKLLPSSAEILADEGAKNQEFLSLCTPAIGRDSIALHAVLLGHEMGHLRDWQNDVSKAFDPPTPQKWRRADGELDLAHDVAFEAYVNFVADWGEELVSDIFSCLRLGPVALLAFPEVVGATAHMNHDSLSHPAPDRRIRLMAEMLTETGFAEVEQVGEVVKEYAVTYADAWQRAIDLRDPDLREAAQEAWRVLRNEIPAFKRRCIASMPTERIVTPDIWELALKARNRLREGLPCGEHSAGHANSIAVILNAAWMVKIEGLVALAEIIGGEAATTKGIGKVSQVLDGLVVKSIEIANMLGRPV